MNAGSPTAARVVCLTLNCPDRALTRTVSERQGAGATRKGLTAIMGGKRVNERNRHVGVDVVAQLLKVMVHPVLEAMAGHFPRLNLVLADQGNTGDLEDLCDVACGWRLVIVKGAPQNGLGLHPRRRVARLAQHIPQAQRRL